MSEPAAFPEDAQSGAEIVQFRPRNTLASKVNYAKELAVSDLLPAQYRKKPANVLWAIEFGEALGISAMTALTGVHVIDGKPTASAALISALVRRAGHRLRVTGDDKKATAQLIRKDDPEFTFESTWTLDRAKQAGLTGKKVWQQYPAAMLKARAITEVARDACEEALNGCRYTAEELGAEVDEEGVPTTLVEQVSTSGPGWDAEIARRTGDRDALIDLYKRAPNDEIKQRIIAAAKKSGVAAQKDPEPESEVEVVDGEIVEDTPPPAPNVAQLVDGLIAAGTDEQVTALAGQVSKIGREAVKDITGILDTPDKANSAELDIQPGERVNLTDLVALVQSYVAANGYSVANGVKLAAEQAEEAS